MIKLQQKDGRGYSSIHSIQGVLRPACQMAVDNDLIRKNPFGFEPASIVVNDSVTREAITRKQERAYPKFVKKDRHFSRYDDVIYILFHTGLWNSEFCGLMLKDIEFLEKRSYIDHQLRRKRNMEYYIVGSKTEAGERYFLMTGDVMECFHRTVQNRVVPKNEPMVVGYVGFLYLDKNDMPMLALH